MPDFVEIAVIFALFLTVLLGRDDNVYSGRKRESNDFRCVIATIGQKILGGYSLDKAYSLPAISSGALCDNSSDWHTRRIHGKVNPGVKPPFVRLISGGSLVSSTFGAKVSGTAASGISEILSANFTKAEGLAFIFAISFNMPCVSALAATARETHSAKWTAKIGVFYTLAALLVACIVYHIGLLIF